jgi:subtilisin family serine protease
LRTQRRKAGLLALAVGAAVALTTSAALPAGAAGAAASAATGRPATRGAGVAHWVTLVTGDRIGVDAHGKPVAVRHAAGREHIPVQVHTADGHSYAIPLDAAGLVRAGTVDQRLFDVTALSSARYRKAAGRRGGLGLIVTYTSPATGKSAQALTTGTARQALRAATGAGHVTHTYPALDGESVTAPDGDAAAVWRALTTAPRAGTPYATAAAGLGKVWLDAVRAAPPSPSAAQSAPVKTAAATATSAEKTTYNGKGVTIAVLDTGIDARHPDLKGRVIASKIFSGTKTADDKVGHGTHVASIAAGTGAESHGKYAGVAPGASLLNGKVLDDAGEGEDSAILAGMEWAAGKGARIVNLSLGGADTPGADPLETAIDTLSKADGTLFAVAAGNDGPDSGSIDSPGSADAAITVGAVNHKGRIADFSSRGPRVGDGAVKPDLTAIGVDVTAADAPGSEIDQDPSVDHPAAGYVTLSGTSMATPQVAGSAAVLAQRHPTWSGARLKAALIGSARPAAYSAYTQGAGQLDLARALKQTVVADTASVSFGIAQWPHTDDKPIARTLTYRNTTGKAITLGLKVTATGPGHKAAPHGFVTLGKDKLSVPAHGTAHVTLTADTRLGSTDGDYYAYVKATGGGQTVTTAAGVVREVKSYTLTLHVIDQNGAAARWYEAELEGISGKVAQGDHLEPYDPSGTVKVRVPAGHYVLSTNIFPSDPNTATSFPGAAWIADTSLDMTHDSSLTVDARTARPVDVTIPDAQAEPVFAEADLDLETPDYGTSYGWLLDSFAGLSTGSVGAAAPAGELSETFGGTWTHGSHRYDLVYPETATRLPAGFTAHPAQADLATVTAGLGAPKAASGYLGVEYATDDDAGGSFTEVKLPGTVTESVDVAPGTVWLLDEIQGTPDDPKSEYVAPLTGLTPGGTSTATVGTGVFGPYLDTPAAKDPTGSDDAYGIFRDENDLIAALPVFADGSGDEGGPATSSGTVVLYRDGKKLTSTHDSLDQGIDLTVPPGKARYRLATVTKRSTGTAGATSQVGLDWTFSSGHAGDWTGVPASVVRFTPALALDSTAPAGAKEYVPVSVDGFAAVPGGTRSLAVRVSTDHGRHWTPEPVHDGGFTIQNPAAGGTVSFRAFLVDAHGNTATETITDAYVTR